MNHVQDKSGSLPSSSTGSEEELRVRFAPLAEESLFTEQDPSNERSESQQIPTKTSDHHVSLQGAKTARQRTVLKRRGNAKVCMWNHIQNIRVETNNQHAATIVTQEAQVVHQDLKIRYHEVLTSLNDSLQALKDSGASQSLRRLARLKARQIRRPMRIFFEQRSEDKHCRDFFERGSCGQIYAIDLFTKGLNSFNSWVAKAKAVETKTSSLIDLNHPVDLEVEDAADELVQQEANELRTNLDLKLRPRVAKIVGELRAQRRLLLHTRGKGQKELAACHLRLIWVFDERMTVAQGNLDSTACPRCSDRIFSVIGFCTQCCYMLNDPNPHQSYSRQRTNTEVANGSNDSETEICHYDNCLHHDLCGMRHVTYLDCMWTPTHRYCLDCRGAFICRLHCSGCDWESELEDDDIYCQICGELNVYTVNCGSCGLYKINGRGSNGHGQDCTQQCSKFKAKGRVLCTYSQSAMRSPYDSSGEESSEGDEDQDSDSNSDSDDDSDDCLEPNPESPYANQSVRDPTSADDDAENCDISDEQSSGSNFNEDKGSNEAESAEDTLKTTDLDIAQLKSQETRRCSRCSWVLPFGRKPCVKFHFGMNPHSTTSNNEDLCKEESELCTSCQSEEQPNPTNPAPSIDKIDLDVLKTEHMTDITNFQIFSPGERHHALPLAPGELSSSPESPVSPTFCDWASSPPHTFTPSEVTEIIARWRAKNKRHRQPSAPANDRCRPSSSGQPARSPIQKRSSTPTSPPFGPMAKRCSASLRQADIYRTHGSPEVSPKPLPLPQPLTTPIVSSISPPSPVFTISPNFLPTNLSDLTPSPFLTDPHIANLHKHATLNALTQTLFMLESQPLCPLSKESTHIATIKNELRSQIESLSAELGVRADSRVDGISLDEAFALLSVHPVEASYEKRQIDVWRRLLAQSRRHEVMMGAETENKGVISDQDLTEGVEGSEKESKETSEPAQGGYILGTDVYRPLTPRPTKRRLSSSSSSNDENSPSFNNNNNATPAPKRVRMLDNRQEHTSTSILKDAVSLKRQFPFSENHDASNIDVDNHNSADSPKAKRIRTSTNTIHRPNQASSSSSSSSSSSASTSRSTTSSPHHPRFPAIEAQRLHSLNSQSWTSTATQLISFLRLARQDLIFSPTQADNLTAGPITEIIVQIDQLLNHWSKSYEKGISNTNTNTLAPNSRLLRNNHYPICLTANALLNDVQTLTSIASQKTPKKEFTRRESFLSISISIFPRFLQPIKAYNPSSSPPQKKSTTS